MAENEAKTELEKEFFDITKSTLTGVSKGVFDNDDLILFSWECDGELNSRAIHKQLVLRKIFELLNKATITSPDEPKTIDYPVLYLTESKRSDENKTTKHELDGWLFFSLDKNKIGIGLSPDNVYKAVKEFCENHSIGK